MVVWWEAASGQTRETRLAGPIVRDHYGSVSGTALDRGSIPTLELEKVPRFAGRRDLQTGVLGDRPDCGHLMSVG